MFRIGQRVVGSVRRITTSVPRLGGNMTLSSVLPSIANVPTVDHLMSVERAALLMADKHVDALPVTKNDKVIGMFTERDYFEKVLNKNHEAGRSSVVGEVATMGSELVVAHPNDTIEGCLEVMMKKNLMLIPVVENDGHAIGTISVMDLTKQYMDANMEAILQAQTALGFSEPSHFPENFVLHDGGIHYDEMKNEELIAQLKLDLETIDEVPSVDSEWEERAAEMFSEGSVFPECTPVEEVLMVQGQGEAIPRVIYLSPRDERVDAAHAELLNKMDYFCEASDFPEAAPLDEVIQSRLA